MTAEFDYQLRQTRTILILKDLVHRTELLRWVVSHISERGPKPAKVTSHTEGIVKASFSFPPKVWWVVVRSCIQPTLADKTGLVASILAR